jgi:TonB family protein
LVEGAVFNLFEIHNATKKYGEAQKLMDWYLKLREEKGGLEHPRLAILLDRVAVLAYIKNDFQKSEAAYKRALAIREKAFGQNHAEFAKSLYSLAEFYRFTGKFDKAQPLYEQATILRKKLFGPDNPEYLKTKDRYFCLAYETLQDKKLKEFTEKLDASDGGKPTKPPEELLNGRAVSLPRPSYPEEARRERLQGVVIIKVTINELGNVTEASDMCGANPILAKTSVQAAREARFIPTKVSGRPITVTGVITYNFVPR